MNLSQASTFNPQRMPASNMKEHELRQIHCALVEAFIDAVSTDPTRLLPCTFRLNTTPEHCPFPTYRYVRSDKPASFWLEEAFSCNGAAPKLVAMFAADRAELVNLRDAYIRELAEEYAEAEAHGVQKSGGVL